MKYDFIIIGGAAEDITFLTNDGVLLSNKKDILRQELMAFEYGAKIEIDRVYYNFGGGAANAAVCLARLGFNVANIGAIGDDERGKRILENFKKHKVDASLVQKVRGGETSFSFILVGKSRDRIIFFSRGAERQLRIANYELQSLRKAKWAYVTSLSGRWEKNLKKIFGVKSPLSLRLDEPKARQAFVKGGTMVAWNPGNAQLAGGIKRLSRYLRKTEVFIVNKDEAIELAMSDKKYRKQPRSFLNKADNLLKIIHFYGPKITVITNGRQGAHAYDGKKVYFQPIIKEKKKADTTGVGDAFGSSFVAGLELYKGDIQKAMRLGAKNAASVVSEVGAQNGLIKTGFRI
ncbi:carbohydrate kinase family protein [Candidatus Falkowbacteria bacterium]|nr:carbohydrate kinase family protein [Candidatus Falkowbacteria bacterium]